MGRYLVGQACRQGHAITGSVDFNPEEQEAFCSRCGAETMMACDHCCAKIRGNYYMEGVYLGGGWRPPRYCHACGRAYPWTEVKLAAASQLIDELDDLSPDDRLKLKSSVEDLLKDAPASDVAVIRVKKAFLGLGKVGGESLRNFLVDVLSETAKKAMGL